MNTNKPWEKEESFIKGFLRKNYSLIQKHQESCSHKQADKQASEFFSIMVLQDTAQAGIGMKQSCSEFFSDTPNPKIHPKKTSKQLQCPAVLFFLFFITIILLQNTRTSTAANINIISPQTIYYGINNINFIINTNETFDGFVLYNLTNNLIPNENNFTFEKDDFEELNPELKIINHTFLVNASLGFYTIETLLYRKLENGTTILENIDYKTGNVFFDNVAPTILTKSPNGIINNYNVIMSIVTNENSLCSFSEDNETWILMLGNEKNHTYNLTSILELEGDGDYFYYIYCKDNFDNKAYTTINFSLDTTAPNIVSSEPSNLSIISSKEFEIKIVTNENSICRYSFEKTNFQSMNSMTDIGTIHTLNLNLEDKTYTLYFLCKDYAENIMEQPFMLLFTVDTPPRAEIEFKERISYGTFEVRVKTSEEVKSITLGYVLSSDPSSTIIVPLIGSGREYKGFILIEQDAGEQIGSFSVLMEDLKGNKGTEITTGKIFIVDTIAPKKITVFKATPSTNSARLSWYSEDKDISYYNIYRSENPGITELDYYTKTTNDYFIDSITIPYYYAIRAVDKAGNIGSFSEEIYVEPLKPTKKISVSQQSLNRIAEKIREIENIKKEIEVYNENINSRSNKEKSLLSVFGIDQKIASSKSEITKLIDELNSLKESTLPDEEIISELQRITLKAKSVLSTTPKDFQILEEKTIEQSSNYEDFVFAYKKIFGKEDKNYIDNTFSKTKDKTIKTTITSVRITYENNFEEKTLIEENIILSSELEKVFIIEVIPKEISESASDILFLQNNYQIIESDPIIKYDFSNFRSGKISYIINKRIYSDSAEKLRTIILLPETTEVKKQSKITGLLVSNITNLKNYGASIGIILGIIIIVFLLIYYLNMDSTQTISRKYDRTLPKELLKKESIIRKDDKEKKILDNNYVTITKKPEIHAEKTDFQINLDSFEEINNSIKRANFEIDNLNFDTSNRIYTQLNTLTFNNFDEEKIRLIKREINNLQNKIMLYLKIEEAKQRAKNNERMHLKQVLTTIEVLYKLIKNFENNTNTPLMNLAKHIYNNYRSDRLE
ncbi:MAG: hypothetical protein QXU20_03585 [Candidatus Woesearchaeota archaeon]